MMNSNHPLLIAQFHPEGAPRDNAFLAIMGASLILVIGGCLAFSTLGLMPGLAPIPLLAYFFLHALVTSGAAVRWIYWVKSLELREREIQDRGYSLYVQALLTERLTEAAQAEGIDRLSEHFWRLELKKRQHQQAPGTRLGA